MATAEAQANYAEILQNLEFLTLTNKNLNLNYDEEIFKNDSSKEIFLACKNYHKENASKRLKIDRFRRRFVPYWYSEMNQTSNFRVRNYYSTPEKLSTTDDLFFQTNYYHRLRSLVGALDVDDFEDKPGLLLLNPNVKHKNSRLPSELTCSAQARRPESSPTPSTSTSTTMNSALTIGELAAYLDDYLYIPKKMSFMAENMYT